MLADAIIRFLYVVVPAAILAEAFLGSRHTAREKAGALLGILWQALIGLMVCAVGVRAGWWHFDAADGGSLYGVAIDLVLAQALIGGVVSFSARGALWLALPAAIGGVFAAYAVLPFLHPGHAWPIGSVWMVALVIAPSIVLAHTTATDTWLPIRAILQPILWLTTLLWLVPTILLVPTGIGWSPLLSRPPERQALYSLPLLIPAYLLISAFYRFARDGGGTGFPYDPPKRLVSSGIYARLANPMQLGTCLLMAWWGVMVQCVYVSVTGLIAVALFTVFRDICNGSLQVGRTDRHWAAYQRTTPRWVPRLWGG